MASVKEVIELASSPHEYCATRYENSTFQPHEANSLALETAKARTVLSLQPCWSLAESVTHTMAWYRAQQAGADALSLCCSDIERFTDKAKDVFI
jgi:CDP-glucose 4,6-dehydratase